MKRDDASGLSELVEDRPHEHRPPGLSELVEDRPHDHRPPGLSELVEDRPHEKLGLSAAGPCSTGSDRPVVVAPPTVLILGAGGFLGRNTVQAFLDAGLVPRCGRRARGNVLGLRGLGCPLVVTDFAAPLTLRNAFAGVEVLVHAAAHYPRFSNDPSTTLARGYAELDAVLDAAADAGVKRLVFVSSTATVAPSEGHSTESDVFETEPTFGTYHALKWHLEARLQSEHRFEVSIALPSACLGPHDWKVGTSALLVATARGLRPPHPAGRISCVDARDVSAALLKLATMNAPPSRLILSNESFDAHVLLTRLAERYGAPTPPPPLSAADAIALADQQEEEAHRLKGRAALSRELVDLILHAPRLDASLSRALGLTYRPLSETLDAWDSWARRMGILSSTPEVSA